MKKGIMALLLIIILGGVSAPLLSHADMEWRVVKELQLKDQPLDMANALDGKTLFILVSGEVLIQSMRSNDISQRIPVGKEFDRLAYSPRNNTLILTSSSAKTLKIIQLDRIHQFDYSGLPYLGPKNAPVTIAVFSDYQWPACARLESLIHQVMNKYPGDVKFYFKNFPLNIHKYAKKASIAALAADKQDKFEAFHNKLFENYRKLNDKKFLEIAGDLGLNMETFDKDINSASVKNLVNRDMMEGQKIGVRSTPSVFINGKLLKRRNFKSFQLKIDAELKKAP